ncbi:hypothetical protein [Kitasatospora sp. GP82]|uniref:hypothetical protein n=1 Tax=Kitasatospora sp. GP82 TaxID=3035089 RepID=UPI0024743DC5|nr:hypothetical protein [Kitasatospora sp. GP82]MDH6125668.1 hypothetical protein [Kitasatospora sp. GP82]
MITELAVERVEFTCGHCWHSWSADYDVQHYRDEEGNDWEYFSHDGIPVASPYSPDGAPACPGCHRHWVGHLTARRLVPLPDEEPTRPRTGVIGDPAQHRPERHAAPQLSGTSHQQPTRQDPTAIWHEPAGL